MAEILLLHGAWHGGWCWRDVAGPLRNAGHNVHTPTFLGLGETAHLLNRDVGLYTHVDQMTAAIGDAARDLIVCGHSYGGAVTRMLEDRLPKAFKAAIYLEGAVPRPGECILDLNGAEIASQRLLLAKEQGDGWRLPVPDPIALWPGLGAEQANWIKENLTEHPLKGFTDRQPKNPKWADCRHIFVFASDRDPQPYQSIIDDFTTRQWETAGMKGGHELMISRAAEVVDIITRTASEQEIPRDYG